MAELTRVFQALALRHLERKQLARKGVLQQTGLTLDDLALDCLAEVFRRDRSNKLVELVQFVGDRELDVENASDELLLASLREFVSRKINDCLFRIYQEIDPPTGRILRNLKLAIEKSKNARIVERLGESYVVPISGSLRPNSPLLTYEDIEEKVRGMAAKDTRIPVILGQFMEWLSAQESFHRSVRLSTLAVSIKGAFEQLGRIDGSEVADPDEGMLSSDVLTVIYHVCQELDTELRPRYTGKGKTDNVTFSSYLQAIGGILKNEFLEDSIEYETYFEHLRKAVPSMTKEDYLQHHRTVFEYIAKLAKERTREQIRRL